MNLPETSHYHDVQDKAYKERMEHQKTAMNVEVLADKLVTDILGEVRGPIWHGALALVTRFMTWALPGWYVDKLVNGERGVEMVRRR